MVSCPVTVFLFSVFGIFVSIWWLLVWLCISFACWVFCGGFWKSGKRSPNVCAQNVLSVDPFRHKLLRMWYCRKAVCSTRCFYSCASLQQGIWAENSRGSLQHGMLPCAELAEGAGKVIARRFAFHGIRAWQLLFSQCQRRSYTIAWWAHQWKYSSIVTPIKPLIFHSSRFQTTRAFSSMCTDEKNSWNEQEQQFGLDRCKWTTKTFWSLLLQTCVFLSYKAAYEIRARETENLSKDVVVGQGSVSFFLLFVSWIFIWKVQKMRRV